MLILLPQITPHQSTMKSRPLIPKGGNDVVMTPRPLARKIVEHFSPSGSILEPCKGDGAFTDALMGYGGVFSCEITEGLDFFDFDSRVDWIVTNPPWSKFRQFLIHSMSLADDIVFLVTINHFFTKARMRDIYEADFRFVEVLLVDTPPSPWPQSGFQLGAVHIKRNWRGQMKFSDITTP